MKRLFSIDCRMVGPGGTYIQFFQKGNTDEIIAVWENENCPYGEEEDMEYPCDCRTPLALDGHNVSKLSRKALLGVLGGVDK
jgi:hypothetical protein